MGGNTWSLLLDGFAIALQPHLLLYSLAGAFLGTVVGVLPGLGPAGAVALLLPVMSVVDPIGAVIMLAATYTARCTADRRPPFCCASPATQRLSLPRSTATKWPSRGAPGRRCVLPRSVPTSPGRSPSPG